MSFGFGKIFMIGDFQIKYRNWNRINEQVLSICETWSISLHQVPYLSVYKWNGP